MRSATTATNTKGTMVKPNRKTFAKYVSASLMTVLPERHTQRFIQTTSDHRRKTYSHFLSLNLTLKPQT